MIPQENQAFTGEIACLAFRNWLFDLAEEPHST